MILGHRSQARKTQGRRKINMVKMENESNLQVTFSKRRLGLFKKANELCTLSGAEATIVVFSPGDKAHSFGHPDVKTIANRFINSNSPSTNVSDQLIHIPQSSNPNSQKELEYLARVESQIEVEKARGEGIDMIRKTYENENLVPTATFIEELNYEQLDHLKRDVTDFGQNLKTHVEKTVNPMAPYNVTSSTYFTSGGGFPLVLGPCPNFDVSSIVTMVPYGVGHETVIPYDNGAIEAGGANMSHQYGTGCSYGHELF